MSKTYDANSIQILEGLEAVRKRPGMYIGSTDSRGLHHLVWEILDNSIDEALNGYGDEISITIESNNIITIEDYGRGLPVGQHASGKNSLEVIFTILHAGGKFSSDGGYKSAGGLHGVGASVVNALSKWVQVTVHRDNKEYKMTFKDGGKDVSQISEKAYKGRSGSKISFLADDTIFSTTKYSFDVIKERVQESAFLLSGLKFNLKDLRDTTKPKELTFQYENGLNSFMEYLHEDKKVLHKPILITNNNNPTKQQEGITIDIALQYTETYQENTYSYVNLVRTKDGGTHETGFKVGLTRAINDFARKNNLLKAKEKNFDGSDIREGLTSIVAIGVPENILQFEGQTKGKLGTPQAKSIVENMVNEQVGYYLEENRDFATQLIKKIQKSALARQMARKARDEAREGKKGKRIEKTLSGKLVTAQKRDPSRNELYLVEGDSAGGTAKQGRDSKFQAILPLRGKVLNVERATLASVYKNEELNTIVHCIGAGIGSDFDIKYCNYDKIIIMTDADVDGSHIQILLITFLYTYMRPMIEQGHVFIAKPPLYKVTSGKNSVYCYTDEELELYRTKWGKLTIQRYKGLGEMNADQLWETTMNPDNRTLIRVTVDDGILAEKRIKLLMGDKAEPRREWIDENINFSEVDTFTLENSKNKPNTRQKAKVKE